jgi:hypothetical protein
MRLACEIGVKRLESPGGSEEQWRSVTSASQVEGDLRPCTLKSSLTELVERLRVCGRQERLGCQEVSRVELRLRGSQCSESALVRVLGERDRYVQKGGGRGNAAAAFGPACRIEQLLCDGLVWGYRSVRPMPGAPVRVAFGIGGGR